MELSLAVNNLLAAPSFAAWMEGEPLDVQRLLYSPSGRPRISVLSIAHLGDAERMFFVSFLLNEVVAWMRRQPGTSSLRALLYMDEILGFFPPTAKPPSKPLMLTLLKQARAFGLGVVLSTQNPVDLDYKGLANAGTWFLGRLQTERDRERMLDGLLGAAGGGLDRAGLSAVISSLESRRFLWHSVHANAPQRFESRWALSYLRGPLSRPQIRMLAGAGTGSAAASALSESASISEPARPSQGAGSPARPVLPPDVPEFFVNPLQVAGELRYAPSLLGSADVHYVSARHGIDEWQRIVVQVPLGGVPLPNPWDSPDRRLLGSMPDLQEEPPAPAAAGGPAETTVPRTPAFDPLPAAAAKPRSYAAWSRGLATFVYQSCPLRRWSCPGLKQVSRPGESQGDFRVRIAQAGREARDADIERIRARYASKRQTLTDRIRRAEDRIAREQSQLEEVKRANTIQIGASVVGALLGGRRRGFGGLSAAARGVSRTQREETDVVRAAQEAEALRAQLTALDAEIEQAVLAVQAGAAPGGPAIEPLEIAPRKADTTVGRVALVWVATGK
jgi:hypothetical protein